MLRLFFHRKDFFVIQRYFIVIMSLVFSSENQRCLAAVRINLIMFLNHLATSLKRGFYIARGERVR